MKKHVEIGTSKESMEGEKVMRNTMNIEAIVIRMMMIVRICIKSLPNKIEEVEDMWT